MTPSTHTAAFILLAASSLAACGGKSPSTAAGAAAATSGTSALSATSAAGGGSYHGVPIYPGMIELMTHDSYVGPEGSLHSGSYRSNDKADQIHAYYKEQLTKLFGAVVRDQATADGMVRMDAGTNNQLVTILIHTGDSGEQVVGIQVTSKN